MVMLARIQEQAEQEAGGNVFFGLRESYNKLASRSIRQTFYAHVSKGVLEGETPLHTCSPRAVTSPQLWPQIRGEGREEEGERGGDSKMC